MLSLLNGSALGFDLVRLQHGPLVAGMVLSALAVRPEDLGHLPSVDAGPAVPVAPAGRAPQRPAPTPHVPAPPSGLHSEPHSDLPNGTAVRPPGELRVRDVPARASSADSGADPSSAALASLLRSATIGSLESLVAMMRREVFAWTWQESADSGLASRSAEAGDLQTTCLAAVSAAYGAVDLRDPHVQQALERWDRLFARLPRRSVPLGPQQMQLAVLLARVQALRPREVRDIVDAYHRHQPAQLWAPAVHEATWAAYLSGRVAAAAAAQLHLVSSVRSAGVSLDDVAGGFWNAVSGAVSALVVYDLLDDVSCDLLLARYPVLARPTD
jgi:hypothetical protein